MLKNLTIKKLFGLYDYNLTFSSSPEDKIRFITAPNGYGKSTILRLIDGIYNQHFDVFFKVPFQNIQFTIDEIVFTVHQYIEQSINADSDADGDDGNDEVSVAFAIGSTKPSPETRLTLAEVNENNRFKDLNLSQICTFFSSEKCKYIDDRRLLRENTDSSELVRLADYIKDKFNRQEDISSQISTLEKIVNRSEFANKHMEIGVNCGFRFVVDNEDKTKLTMKDLSSGEQHILLLTLYMLFEAQEKTIILIDEPEMSFHLSWQGDYLRNLKDIVALKNVQCIVATHSPHVFNSDWDLSLDLYDQLQSDEEK